MTTPRKRQPLGKRRVTEYVGVYAYEGRDDVHLIRYRNWNNEYVGKAVYGSAADASRAREELLRTIRPQRFGAGFAAPDYLDLRELEWILDAHSADPCIYVGQRKINPVIVKIGYSTYRGVRKRAQAERLHLLLVLPGGRDRERELHQQFADYVCDVDGAEFFFLTRALREWIDDQRSLRLQIDQDATDTVHTSLEAVS